MNHTTTASNTFIVFLQADFFFANRQLDSTIGQDVTQIGAKMPNSPGYRGFFLIDRTKAMEILQPGDFPSKTSSRTFSMNQNIDWRKLVLYRLLLN